MIDRIALALTVIGGVNWGLVGVFRFDLVAWICGGQTAVISRIIYTLVGISALWCLALLFRDWDSEKDMSVAHSAR
ncbi:DUF378 domain-containing protein [Acutalibacter muris]|uniref:DUF378 domain-containing protein n=1 Tax=Acutalibacter muris TaxID=1796620 RepID=A0ABM6LBA0_9FIRM|nr:DUF378 domain-containing protein [Acutalibacter muris]ANU54047.2 DUF378 domain-containing protein [Hungateiclostridiaceae bacterium KB18]ASB42644.1 DUF378 domain-containing protein [Acutalibacter muris]